LRLGVFYVNVLAMQEKPSDDPLATSVALEQQSQSNSRARRRPVQGRSTETVQKIYEATSRLLGKNIPIEEMTTSQIAMEAGISIGALYRFFPDKQAIVDAVALRRLGEFQAVLLHELMPSMLVADGPALLSRAIDTFVSFVDAHADFRTIAFGGRHISRRTREEHSGADAGATALVKQYMVTVLGFCDSLDLDLRLRVGVETGERLLGFALEQSDSVLRQKIIVEMKRILSAYLFDKRVTVPHS
jgi:AcrR family transcriptional regulator